MTTSAILPLQEEGHRVERAAFGGAAGLWEWRLADNRLWWSERLAETLGYASEELPQHLGGLDALLHRDERDRVMQELREGARRPEGLDIALRAKTKHRGYRWFRVTAALYADGAGEPRYLSGGMRDITEQKAAADQLREKEQQLQQQDRMDALDCLAGGIAHEFNNVLQAVRGYIDFAMGDLAEGCQAHDDLQQAVVAINRAASLTRSLLDFARAEEPDADGVEIGEALHGLGLLLRPVIGADVDLRMVANNQPLWCSADSRALRQSLLNLCINARDAMPHGGQLVVSAEPFAIDHAMQSVLPGLAEGWYAAVRVTDSGSGIPDAIRGRVFDPFFTTKEVGHGTGLGLATVYGFAQRSEGRLTVHSQQDVGTTFCIYLPIEEPHGMANDPRDDALRAPHPCCVLLVEDDRCVQEVGRRALELAGYEVLVASDGETGLETYIDRVEDIDLVVLDAVLPRLGGRRVFEEIRRLQSEVPVIFTTAFDPASVAGARDGQHADMTLAKPYDNRTLLAAVRSLVECPSSIAASGG